MDSTWWQSDDSDSDIADILITTDVDQETVNGEVFNAIYYNDLEVVRSLLEAGAALEGTDDYSPLIVAATACDPKMIQLLLNADVPLDFPDADGSTTWMKIRANTAVPIENMIAIINSPNGVDIYAKDESGKSMMPMGNSQTNERLMLQLVYRLAELNSENGESALCLAAIDGFPKVVEWLLENDGIKCIDAPNEYGTTPLMFAIMNRHWKVVKLLLEHGASLSVKCDLGCSALDFVMSDDLKRILENRYFDELDQFIRETEGAIL